MNADGRSPRTPMYRLHKPRNRAVVTIDGRDYYLGPYNSLESKAEYDPLIALLLANGRCMRAEGPNDLTTDQALKVVLHGTHPGGQWVKPRWRWPLKSKKKQHVRAPVDGGNGQAVNSRPRSGTGFASRQ